MSDSGEPVTKTEQKDGNDRCASSSEMLNVCAQRLLGGTQSTDSNQSTQAMIEIGDIIIYSNNDEGTSSSRLIIPARVDNRAAERSRLYRERHREEINQRRRDIRQRNKKSQQIQTLFDNQTIKEIEQITNASSNNQLSSNSHIQRQQRYYERHREEINKRKRDSRLKQNTSQSVSACAAEHNRNYRGRKRHKTNEQKRDSKLRHKNAQRVKTECNINTMDSMDEITNTTPNDQQNLTLSNDNIKLEIEKNSPSASQQLDTTHFGEIYNDRLQATIAAFQAKEVNTGFRYPEKPQHLPALDLVTEIPLSPRIPFTQKGRLGHVDAPFGTHGQNTCAVVSQSEHATPSGSGQKSNKRKRHKASTDSSETSDAPLDEPEWSGAWQPGLCCCCLSSDAAAPLASYADMLNDCFHIIYPEGVRASASICSECVATLKQGVRFKRSALKCQSTMATWVGVDMMQAQVKDEVPTETHNIAFEQGTKITVKEEPVDAVDAGFEVPAVDGAIHNDSLCIRNNDLNKIHEDYDLNTSGEDFRIHVDLDGPIDANFHMQTPLFYEQPIGTSAVLTEGVQLNPEEEGFFQTGCKCGENCHKKFSRFEIAACRRECEKYYSTSKCDINHMDIFLTGALACSFDRSMIGSIGPKSKNGFKFRGVLVCEEFLMFLFVLNKNQYNNVLKKIMDRATCQWTSQLRNVQPSVIKFIKSYSLQNSFILPGRFSYRHPDLHILPRNVTKMSVYCEYTRVCVAMKNKFVNLALWNKIWECFCPYIVEKLPSDLCRICRENAKLLSGASVLSMGLMTETLERCLQHLRLVSDETDYFESVMQRPLGDGGTLHCSVDFLRRLRLPLEPAAGPLHFLDAYEVALFAVTCQPPGESVVYIIPECVGDDNGNILVSLLNHFLESKSARSVQCHCGPLLRAERVLQYAAWRGRAGRCRLAFLPPGHDAHIRADCRALLQRAARDEPARTVQDLCNLFSSIGVIPVPVAYENGHLNIPIFNWLAFFDARNPAPVANIQSYCHFEADSGNIGAIKCKVSVKSNTVDLQTVFESGCLAGAPEVLSLAGLAPERHAYLYDRIREHLDESVKDVLCPKDMQDPLQLKTEIKMEFEEHDVALVRNCK